MGRCCSLAPLSVEKGQPFDGKDQPFDGKEKYIMRFEKGKQPHVSAFWSLSMHHVSDGSFVESPIKRYSNRRPHARPCYRKRWIAEPLYPVV